MNAEDLVRKHPYALPAADKERRLFEGLRELEAHHRQRCPGYARILAALPPRALRRLDELAFMPVGIFKQALLASVGEAEITRILTSSGTSGQQVSRILLDAGTAAQQARALTVIMQDFLGDRRLPMLIADQRPALGADGRMDARGAGVAGMSLLGRDHHWLVDAQGAVDLDALVAWRARHAGTGILLFGFTFLVWDRLVGAIRASGRTIDLAPAVLIHGGGWKRMQALQVSGRAFQEGLAAHAGVARCHDFYGMAEQVGSVFVACAEGRYHCPDFADLIIRDAATFAPASSGQPGLIQVLSLLPRSYPGHSLLTEDLGRVLGVDDCPCGRLGRTFAVVGRVPAVALRGCSDLATLPAARP
jgi:hypothetical protein